MTALAPRMVAWLSATMLWWLALLLIALPLVPTASWQPAEVIALDGARFAAPIGASEVVADTLHVQTLAGADGALQVHPLAGIDAADYPVLRYRFDGFPRTLELALVFRRRDAKDIDVVTIPAAGSGTTTLRLADIPAWHGLIDEIGFAQYPGAQSVPATAAMQPFTLVRAELWSPSWRGALAARWDSWVGRRSWVFMSLSALGPDAVTPQGFPLPLLLTLALVGSVALGYVLLHWRGRTLVRAGVIAAALAWLVLDLRWLHGLHSRYQTTRAIYADLTPEQRANLLPDDELRLAAAQTRQAILPEFGPLPVFVDAGSDFQRARLYYHLLPLNVAPVNVVGLSGLRAGERAIVVLYAQENPVFDRLRGMLEFEQGALPAVLLVDEGPLRVYRLGGAGP